MLKLDSLARLRAANRLYAFMEKVINQLPSTTVWTIENPWRSWLWQTCYFHRIALRFKCYFFQFDMCMFGGRRYKRTAIVSQCNIFAAQAAQCDNNHVHEPYLVRGNVFDTSQEAEYPIGFCKSLVDGIVHHFSGLFGWNPSDLLKQLKHTHREAIATGKQPSAKLAQLVPEYAAVKSVKNLDRTCKLPLDAKSLLTKAVTFQSPSSSTYIPAHAKLLRRTSYGGSQGAKRLKTDVELKQMTTAIGGPDATKNAETTQTNDSSTLFQVGCQENHDKSLDEVVFGLQWEPLDFISKAVQTGHPQHIFSGLQDDLLTAVEANVRMTPAEMVIHRGKWFSKYLRLAKDLEGRNNEILASMPPSMRNIMKSKRLALLERIIQDESYVDVNVAADMAKGFSLVGEVPEAGGRLPPKLVPAAMAVQQLDDNAERARHAIRTSARTSGDLDVDQQLYDKTLAEVERGWLMGPLPWDSLEENAVVSRRFGLVQGSKLRPIDDYSASLINSTVTTRDQPTTDGVDTIAAMFISLVSKLRDAGKGSQLQSRSFDLSAAYRQLCVSESSKPFSYTAVYNPKTEQCDVFQQICLPFGSKSAVNAFIRCARCIQYIAAKCLYLPTTCYYDDFVLASVPALAANSEACMSMLFQLLGWEFDREGPKADSFSSSVTALGVVFDLSGTSDGFLEVKNTDKRKSDVLELIDACLDKKQLQKKEAQVLRGKLSFAYSQIFGLSGKFALQCLSDHTYSKPFRASISSALSESLTVLGEKLAEGKPRRVTQSAKHNYVILTDASFEQDASGGIGGILVSPTGSIISWYERKLSKEEVALFMRQGQEVAIAELETLAVVISLLLWNGSVQNSHAILCLDNDASRFALIKGYAKNSKICCLVQLAANLCEEHCIMPWYLRVPTCANLADFPSRLKAHHSLLAKCKVPSGDVEMCFASMLAGLRETH